MTSPNATPILPFARAIQRREVATVAWARVVIGELTKELRRVDPANHVLTELAVFLPEER